MGNSRWWERATWLRGRMNPHNSSTSATVYPEAFFRGLIQQELKRAAYAGDCCRLLLVYHDDEQGRRVQMESRIVSRTISALARNIRDTDYLGWYRDQYVLGAVLVFGQEGSPDGAARAVERRLFNALHVELVQENVPEIQVLIIGNGFIENATDCP